MRYGGPGCRSPPFPIHQPVIREATRKHDEWRKNNGQVISYDRI